MSLIMAFTITTEVLPVGAGVIDPPFTVEHGKSVWVYYRGNPGYRLYSVLVDGAEVGPENYPNSYYFSEVDNDHTVTVRYEAVTYGCIESDADECSVCDDLMDVSPDLIANGITPEICASLQNDTGLNPSAERTDGQDLDLMNSCLIGKQTGTIESLELCDWKQFFYGLIPNIYNMFKAMICSICGIWSHVHNMEDEIEQIWNSFDQLKDEVGSGMGTREDKELVLPASATTPGFDIADDWYTTVDASAVYEAGIDDGVTEGAKVAMCAVSPPGTNQTITRELPPGIYRYRWVCAKNGGSADNVSGCYINYGNGSASFDNGSAGDSIASGGGVTGSGTFGFAEPTSVTIRAYGHANLAMGWAMICIYS